jgi:tRNA-2-methylthio-N6-dimethylallyladenosine synthase
MENVLAEVRHLAATGVREVEFLGQTVNAYKDPEGKTLADLLRASARIEGIERIRFTSPHPAQMSEQLMDAMAEAYPRVCPHIHLPVQSGSSTVLRAMRRGHDRSGYLAKIAGLRRRIPGMTFGTDLIVGFPTETREDFAQTLSLLDEVGFSQVYSFAYSPRPAIPALDLGDPIPLGEKLARLEGLQRRQKEIQERVNREWVGRDVSVLVEGSSKRDASEWSGRTPENRVVIFQGLSQAGRFEDLTIVRASAYSLRGELRAVRGR